MLSSGFWQHRNERVDQFLGAGVPLVQIHVATQVQAGDAVRAGQNERPVARGLRRTASRPRTRYTIGRDAAILLWVNRVVFDRVLSQSGEQRSAATTSVGS